MVLKTPRRKSSELLLVLLTGICLAANGLHATESSTASKTTKPAPHAAAKQAGTRTPASHSATSRVVTPRPGTAHYVRRNATSHAATLSSAKATPNHSTTAYASRRQGSSARYRHARPSPPRSLSGQQRLARLHMQPERVQEIQQALIREGYMEGEATGQWDSRTHDAMLRYQTMHGFPPTGLPEAKSLMKLGLGSHPLPPELDRGEVGIANPSPAPRDFTVIPASPPVSQAVPPS